MSFFRHEEIYRPDDTHSLTRSGPKTAPRSIGFDESPAGYSLASCSPAELTSASPAEDDSEGEEILQVGKSIEQQVCPSRIISTEGFTPGMWEQLGNKIARIPRKTVYLDRRRS